MSRLPIVTDSAATAASAGAGHDKWMWSPDAKLISLPNGAYRAPNFATSSVLELDSPQGRLLSSVAGLTIPFRLPLGLPKTIVDRLVEKRYLIPAGELSNYQDMIRTRIMRTLESSHGFIIMPTEKCNFRCKYCYESFERGRMQPAAVEAMSRAIVKKAETVDQLALAFFGGEPLLCADLVLRFSEEAFRGLSARGLPYSASISTNGALLERELFEDLLDVGVVAYQISVDGSREVHDSQRVTISGAPTFDKIVKNLAGMSETDGQFSCVIRCNVQEDDHARVLELFEGGDLSFVKDDPRFIVDVHRIWASDRVDMKSAAHDAACNHESVEHLEYYRLNRELERLGMNTMSYGSLPRPLSNACYAGKPNWFVVGPELSLYKCTVVFDREENRLGRVLEDGTLAFDAEKNYLWTGSNALTDQGCGACHFRVPCGGVACPLTRFSEGSKSCPDMKWPESIRRWAENYPQAPQAADTHK